MSRTPVHIVGCGGHAKVITSMIAAGDRFEIASFIDRAPAAGTRFLDRPVVAEEVFLAEGGGDAVVFGLGEWQHRAAAVARFKAAGFSSFPAVVAPSATVSPDVTVGEGSVLMPGVYVNAGSEIGDFCVLNTGAILDHDCWLGRGAALAPGVTVGGGCRIGGGAYIGIGASVSHGRTLGDGAVLGGGGFLKDDAGAGEFWAGVPASFIRKRAPGETIL
ncbi:NeuD/PglB/VioB family sugar acetyltransferase [Nisaea sediminum]|uniref:NeuD/PglB/VioB family sugar acetyltransferase n=1 Tax=Nisaea sediminum TaxID=2775867 RepID=UPI001868A901|nr:NeuD/PglB/VioB family sugar acetyltransferase [Nisaea sediminum]